MTTTYYFRVADFCFSVSLPSICNIDKLLPSFCTFAVADSIDESLLFSFSVVSSDCMQYSVDDELIEETDNDMGHLSLYRPTDGYYIEIADGSCRHGMHATPDFSSVKAFISWDDRHAGSALSSLIRVAYAQAILSHAAVSIHASAVCCGGRAYLFMGKSGTGKSTHSSLWIKNIPGTWLLNDDNPTIRVIDDKVYVYGTPWSGKTPCYKNKYCPVAGMVRLRQSAKNIFHIQNGADAFVAVYPGCSVIAYDSRLRGMLYDTLSVMVGIVTVGTMECLPDGDAALICHNALTKNF